MAAQSKRTVRDLRRVNRAEVLQRLYFDGPLSRQELGAATGLSSGSISNVVAELAADGLLEEAGVVDSEGGRPRTLLRVAPASGHLIGIDVGETRVRVELFDLSLGELARSERPLVQHGYDVDRIVGHIRAAVTDVLRDADVTADRLVGVGVGVPGIIDRSSADGVVVHGQTVGWDAVPLEKLLRESAELPSHVPFFIDNGAKTLGQAEMWFGGGRGASDAVVVLFGSGVSACVVVDGAHYGGAGSRAVEWGHTTVRVGGRHCRCGSPGCLEAYVGAQAIRERWLESGGSPASSADEETALAALLAAALPAPDGPPADPAAARLLDETAEYLGAGIADLVNLFRPERILVGGWAGLLLGPALLPAVRRYAKKYAMRHPAEHVSIDLGTLGPDAVTLGAATLPLADFFARGGRRRQDSADATADPADLLDQGNWRPVVVERRSV
ncbi:ROK family transcriptional regulator [Streptomyces sp. NBC_01267]|uniref:ROK family transcriptional regulator n=1 Tax=unclassified Streptomyces TaxID=2593676 RepID=UPI002025AB7C|nr:MULTISPECIES: ROK family transcriptional regulator [unclassified Streptomyces]WSV52585.1 ROK family transcriptional regulator [Streptomyces sp. NBC_01014]